MYEQTMLCLTAALEATLENEYTDTLWTTRMLPLIKSIEVFTENELIKTQCSLFEIETEKHDDIKINYKELVMLKTLQENLREDKKKNEREIKKRNYSYNTNGGRNTGMLSTRKTAAKPNRILRADIEPPFAKPKKAKK